MRLGEECGDPFLVQTANLSAPALVAHCLLLPDPLAVLSLAPFGRLVPNRFEYSPRISREPYSVEPCTKTSDIVARKSMHHVANPTMLTTNPTTRVVRRRVAASGY